MNALTQFLESILGKSERGSGGNVKFSCPFPQCSGKSSKVSGQKKFEVDTDTVKVDGRQVNNWHCWICNNKGRSIITLLKALDSPQHIIDQAKEIIKYTEPKSYKNDSKAHFSGIMPPEYKPLAGKIPQTQLKLRHAKAYLKRRGITEDDILKYSIGYCDDGEYSGRVVVPSYDAAGKINYLIARTIYDEVKPKYKNPSCSRDIIPFDLFINWDEPIVLCEGGFDVMAIKRNCVPLLDKELQPELMKKILGSKCKKVYLALDPDAMKQVLKYAEVLLNEGKQVFMLDFDGYKDASDMGFEEFTKAIQKATRLSQSKLIKMKIMKA